MLKDIEINRAHKAEEISEIARKAGIAPEALEQYGRYKAKVDIKNPAPRGKLILVTAVNPTTAGEGKTTCSIALADALTLLGKKTMLALREPSLGPVFGMKGGATGGGYSQVLPMDDINLHFTGDLHAITSANNLLSSVIDNHIFQGNALKINPKKVVWKRCIDLNDRALRHIVTGLGGASDGTVKEDGFNITAASEIMAILCLAENIADLKRRLGNIVVAYDADNKPVTADKLNAVHAMTILLKDAVKPTLVQTLGGTPALIHGGPFANIAHGCNSVIATKTCMSLADFTVTEAGFGADLGAEKFLDVKCRAAGLSPSAVVVVATARALKLHGGADKTALDAENVPALKKGLCNLGKHVENMQKVFNRKTFVAVNRFPSDTDKELAAIVEYCKTLNCEAVITEGFAKGGAGATVLAEKVAAAALTEKKPHTFAYDLKLSPQEKITAVAKKVYGAAGAEFTQTAKKSIDDIVANGYGGLPVIIAKTQYSLSDDAKKLGRPENFTLTVRDVELRAGAGFLVAVAGDIMLMPGLPKIPAADRMQIDDEGNIVTFY